jgi:hypothetical protein
VVPGGIDGRRLSTAQSLPGYKHPPNGRTLTFGQAALNTVKNFLSKQRSFPAVSEILHTKLRCLLYARGGFVRQINANGTALSEQSNGLYAK